MRKEVIFKQWLKIRSFFLAKEGTKEMEIEKENNWVRVLYLQQPILKESLVRAKGRRWHRERSGS